VNRIETKTNLICFKSLNLPRCQITLPCMYTVLLLLYMGNILLHVLEIFTLKKNTIRIGFHMFSLISGIFLSTLNVF
jgi:hypothetical protein